jgi:hypothetical protein
MLKKIAAALFAVATMTTASQAAVIAYFPFLFTGADAGNNLIEDGTYLIVVDIDGDGYNGVSYTSQAPANVDNYSSWQWDAQDLYLDFGPVGTVNGEPGWAFPIGASNVNATDNKNWYLLYFDLAFNPGSTGPGPGVNYAAEDLGVIPSTDATLTPFANGGPTLLTTNTPAPVIPEPASALLALVGVGALARRRNG